jgi:hypothetical protein
MGSGKIMVEFFSTGDEPAFSMDAVHSEGRQGARERAKKTIPEIMVFGWRGALSAIAYEGHGWKGRTHKKIYETP